MGNDGKVKPGDKDYFGPGDFYDGPDDEGEVYSTPTKVLGRATNAPLEKHYTVPDGDYEEVTEVPNLPQRSYVAVRKQYAGILYKANEDVANHQPYLGQMMMDALAKAKDFDQRFLDQTRSFPNSHAVTVLDGFYNSLYNAKEGIFKSPAIAPGKPIKNTTALSTSEEKSKEDKEHIESYRESISSGINLLSTSSNEQQRKFAAEFEKAFDSFNHNLDTINKNLASDTMSEARRLALAYAKPTVMDTVFLQNSNGQIILGDKKERRQTFAPILEQIIFPDSFVEVCGRNTNIIQKGLFGQLLQPLIHKSFGAEGSSAGVDLAKLNDRSIQTAFADDATVAIKRFLEVIDPISKLPTLSKESYDKLGQNIISKISGAKNDQEVLQIKSEVFDFASAFEFIQSAIKDSGKHFDEATNRKITDKLLPALAAIKDLDKASPELQAYAVGKLQKYVTLASSLKSDNHKIAGDDLEKLAEKLITKYDELQNPNKTLEKPRGRSSSLSELTKPLRKILRPRSGSATLVHPTKEEITTPSPLDKLRAELASSVAPAKKLSEPQQDGWDKVGKDYNEINKALRNSLDSRTTNRMLAEENKPKEDTKTKMSDVMKELQDARKKIGPNVKYTPKEKETVNTVIEDLGDTQKAPRPKTKRRNLWKPKVVTQRHQQ